MSVARLEVITIAPDRCGVSYGRSMNSSSTMNGRFPVYTPRKRPRGAHWNMLTLTNVRLVITSRKDRTETCSTKRGTLQL